MKYKQLTDIRQRAYKAIGHDCGIGITILNLGKKYRAEVDIGFDNMMHTLASSDFDDVISAKIWGAQIIRGLIKKLEGWIEKC